VKIRNFRILGAVLAALLPACGGGGGGGGGSGGGTANPAFPVTMTEPKGGQPFTAPATISLSAVAVDPASVATVEFAEVIGPASAPNTWSSGTVITTSTQPPFQATWADAPAGTHTLVAIGTDSLGTQTFSNPVTINVLPPGVSPGGWVPTAMVWGNPSGFWFVDADRGWAVGNGSHSDSPASGVDGTVLRTSDGGTTWVPQSTFQDVSLGKIQFIDSHRGWILGRVHHPGSPEFEGTVLRTTDGGATWISSSVPSDNPFALSFVDADVGWIGGIGTGSISATKDGGVTWTAQPTMPDVVSVRVVRFVDRQIGWVLGVVAQGPDSLNVILHTTDGGLTWTEQLRTGPNEFFGALEFVNPTTGWVSRGRLTTRAGPVQNGGILFTSDGGATWTEQTVPGSEGIFALDFVSPEQGWGAGGPGLIIHTEDGGQSWVTQQSSNPTGDPPIVDVQFIDAHRGWALRSDGILLKTTTGGKAP